jgi:hypothetical protein
MEGTSCKIPNVLDIIQGLLSKPSVPNPQVDDLLMEAFELRMKIQSNNHIQNADVLILNE